MSGIVELGVPEVPIFGILVSPILGRTDCIHHSTTLHFEYICTSLKDIFKDSFTSNLKILVDRARVELLKYGMHPQILPAKEAKPEIQQSKYYRRLLVL